MPNILDATGLTTQTRDGLVAFFTAKYEAIYGSDINLDPDSPDGQMMNVFIQAILDEEDTVTQVYNTFDPDNAMGVILDQRVAINGIQRQAGTFTVTNVTVVVNQSVNLFGLDQTAQAVFTVSDSAGTLWVLQQTQLGVAAGTHVYSFQAAVPGATLTVPNTITVPVTIILGVVSVNNPTTYTTLGINEETDAVLKVRRQQSVSLSSQGYLAGLLAALRNINGITSAFVYENTSSITNVDGVPGHSIWVIVAGTASDADIAQAIYTKRNAGCGMFGSTSFVVTQVDGSPFVMFWDFVVAKNLFIAFTATSINGVTAPNIALIREQLPLIYAPGVNSEVNINQLATLVQDIDPNTLVTNAGFSLALLQIATLSGVAASGQFKVLYNGNLSAFILWNDSIGTIQSKVQAVPGLAGALVTGSIAGQTLNFNIASVGSATGLLSVPGASNTLVTGGAVPITFSFNEGYVNILPSPSKQNQLAIASANIIILPMQLNPATAQVPASQSKQFTGIGGYGDLVYSFQTNNSGGTISPTTGLYTAGVTVSVTDTLLVADAFGNFATASVQVV